MVEAVAGACYQLHAVPPRCLDDGVRVFEGDRERLFDEKMFAACGQYVRMFAVHLVRRCDVDRLDDGIFGQCGDRLVGASAEFRQKRRPAFLARSGAGNDLRVRRCAETRQSEHESPAKPRNAKSDRIRDQ